MAKKNITVIVGAGHAGGRAAGALRAAGWCGPIVLIGREPYAPYEKPPLSKDFLAGRAGIDAGDLHSASFYETNKIDLRLDATAARIATRAQRLWLDDGGSCPYDHLLLCTGARPRQIDVPGANSKRIFYLRTRDDAVTLRESLAHTARLAVIGGGLIGLEVAATAREHGCEVSVFETAPSLLPRLGLPAVSELVREIHAGKGVTVRTETQIRAFTDTKTGIDVLCEDGSRSSFDFVVVGIGIVPETKLAETAGIRCADGIIVNEHCETSVPRIFAAGDVARRHDSTHDVNERLETWQNAEDQATAAAQAILGQHTPYCPTPYVWTNQFDTQIQIAGRTDGAAEAVRRGSLKQRSGLVIYGRDGEIVAVLGVNAPREFALARRLIGSNMRQLDHATLADEGKSLKPLVVEYLKSH